jgi:hypothetical protein
MGQGNETQVGCQAGVLAVENWIPTNLRLGRNPSLEMILRILSIPPDFSNAAP